jgi:hypothetical protein
VTITANERVANGVIDANRDPGAASIVMAPGTIIKTGNADIALTLNDGAGLTNSTSGNIVLASLVAAGTGNVIVQNLGPTAGSGIASAGGLVTATSASFDVNGAGGGGGIGFAGAPINVSVTNLAARTQSGGAFFASPLGLTVGIAGALQGITASGTAGVIQVTAAGPISIAQSITTGTGAVTLSSAGALSETGGTISTAGVLTTTSSGGTTLAAANTVGALNATNTVSGDITFANAGALTVTGATQTGGNATLTTSAGAIVLAGPLSAGAGSFTLAPATDILSGGGSVQGSTVTLAAPAGAIGAPGIGVAVNTPVLTAVAANGIAIDLNASAPVPATVNTLQNTATGDIVLNAHGGATFTTQVVNSNANGNVTINSFSPLDVQAGISTGNSIFLSTGGGTQIGSANDMSLAGNYVYNTTSGVFEVTVGRGADLTLFTSSTPMVLTAPLFPNPVNITKFTFIPADPLADPVTAAAYNTTIASTATAAPQPASGDQKKDKSDDDKKKGAAVCK